MRKFLHFFLFIFASSPAITQHLSTHLFDTTGDSSINQPFNSPYLMDQERSHFLFISAFSATTLYFFLDNQQKTIGLDDINLLNPNNINRLDRFATRLYSLDHAKWSDNLKNAISLAPLAFLLDKNMRKDIWTLLNLTAEVFIYNISITHITKNVFHRARPFTYNTTVPEERKLRNRNNQSFFSGHASHSAAFSFLFASIWSDFHPYLSTSEKFILWGLSVALPASVAYLRVSSGKHFLTDVITGYSIGALIGYGVPKLHKKRDQKMHLYPSLQGLYISYSF